VAPCLLVMWTAVTYFCTAWRLPCIPCKADANHSSAYPAHPIHLIQFRSPPTSATAPPMPRASRGPTSGRATPRLAKCAAQSGQACCTLACRQEAPSACTRVSKGWFH
jgi:hypothetical protein